MSIALPMLSALAQETRLSVFRLLIAEEPSGLPAGEVARRLETPANSMSNNLAILERAGLVTATRQGRSIVYRVRLEAVRSLLLFLVQDCCRGHPEVCQGLAGLLAGPGRRD